MKIRSKYKFLIIVIVTAFLILLSNFSYANMDYKVDNISAIVTNTKVQVEWSNTKDADGYEIYVDIPSIGYRYLGETSYNKVQIIGFTKGEDYAIKVRAYEIENNKKTYSDFSSEIKFKFGETSNITSNIETIKNIKAISLGTTGSLEWDEIKNADGYEVYASLENSDFVNLGTTNATKVTLIGMQEENIYMIKVRPFAENEGEKVYGSFSNTAILKYEKNEEIEETTKPDKVENLQINMQEDVANLTWNNITDADGYEISIEIPGYSDAKYYTSENKITLRGFTEGYTYNVKVSAYKYKNGEKIFGDCSNIGKIKYEKIVEKPATVTGLNVTMNGSAATFRWNSVSEADGYEMVVYIPGYGESKHTITGTSKTMTGFTEKNYNYTVKVRAYKNNNGEKLCGEYSNLVYFKNQEKEEEETTIGKVKGLTVSRNGNAATFKWNSVSGADGYEIVVNIPGIGNCTYTETSTSRYMTGFTNTSYKYTIKVRAYTIENGRKVYGDYSDTVKF